MNISSNISLIIDHTAGMEHHNNKSLIILGKDRFHLLIPTELQSVDVADKDEVKRTYHNSNNNKLLRIISPLAMAHQTIQIANHYRLLITLRMEEFQLRTLELRIDIECHLRIEIKDLKEL